ncbi:MAG: hypothetical protein ACLRZL_10375 [Alistipes communis]
MNYYQSEKEAYVVPRAIVFDVKVEEGFASSGEGRSLPEKKIPNGAIDFSAREQQEKSNLKITIMKRSFSLYWRRPFRV